MYEWRLMHEQIDVLTLLIVTDVYGKYFRNFERSL